VSPVDDGDLPHGAYLLEGGEFPPSSATVQVEFGAHSARGASRDLNGDHYLVLRLRRSQDTLLSNVSDEVAADRFDESGYAMFVADGMGAGGGAAASRLAIVDAATARRSADDVTAVVARYRIPE